MRCCIRSMGLAETALLLILLAAREIFGADPPKHSNNNTSDVAVCLSGMMRTFTQSCAGPAMVKGIARHLDADVYAFIKVGENDDTAGVESQVRRILDGTQLRALTIYRHSTAEPEENRRCKPRFKLQVNLLYQSTGFKMCADALLPRNYGWVVRVRPDARIPFILAGLPDGGPENIVYTANLDPRTCGCTMRDGRCQPAGDVCGRVEDNFALIKGRQAQEAYFLGYSSDWCRWNLNKCPNAVCKSIDAAEAKMGYSLASRNITTRQLALGWRGPSLLREAAARHLCSSPSMKRDHHVITAEAIAAIGPGPCLAC